VLCQRRDALACESGQRLSFAVDRDAQRCSLECLVQQLVLSSLGLDVSGVDVTELSKARPDFDPLD
jgi:hypothetical protein